jgi:hypothetical protein
MSFIKRIIADATEVSAPGVFTGAADDQPGQGGMVATAFPRDFSGSSKRDEFMQAKAQLAQDNTNPLGQVMANDSDIAYVMSKAADVEEANFEAWFQENFYKADLAQRAWARDIYPEFFNKRAAKMAKRAKFALRVKLLQLLGPRNEEDLALQFGLNTGRIALGKGWDRIGYSAAPGSGALASPAEQLAFKKQLMSPNQYPNTAVRAMNAMGQPFYTADSNKANTFGAQLDNSPKPDWSGWWRGIGQ